MKLLILAQVPPPLHGQSLMVELAVRGLPAHGIDVAHVNLRLSRDHADIGGWRPGKILAILDACFHAVVTRFRENCDTLYFVPAPAKRGALYRDWLVMVLCRPFFRRLVLHFHNGGLGDWVNSRLTVPERIITQALLGRADLAIVQNGALRSDPAVLAAQRIAIVPNGIPDPGLPPPRPARPEEIRTVLFLSLCSEEKGVFELISAVHRINASAGRMVLRLVAAGSFPDRATESRFRREVSAGGGAVHHVGFAREATLERLWTMADCLCLPTRYPHEAQPLVLLDALARDLPIVSTVWRGIPETVPTTVPLAHPGDAVSLAKALECVLNHPPPQGLHRRWFEQRFTADHHLAALANELRS